MNDVGPIVVFGDSLAVGVGQALAVHHRVIEQGIVGWGLFRKDVPPRLDALRMASADGSVVLISVGTNDTPGRDYADRLRRLRAAVAGNARVVWLLPPTSCRGHLAAERAVPMIIALADETGDLVIDASTCDPNLRATDGVHYTPRGYRAIAEEVVR